MTFLLTGALRGLQRGREGAIYGLDIASEWSQDMIGRAFDGLIWLISRGM